MGGQTKIAETIHEYNPKNVFLEPIPFEMIRTYVENPQLTVTVDGYPAVCPTLDCNFTYTSPTSEVTSFTYTSGTKLLEISGTNLPSYSSEIYQIIFAQTVCVIDADTISSTGIQCTLEAEPTCGAYHPEYYHTLGLIPAADGLA
mmetsp:Transcript_20884/g.32251  ORF Transcript_20884/g.32251 Transcript_20884/m.32251 type:complete len:145 (+) Transcript_20884:2347-2781(+)